MALGAQRSAIWLPGVWLLLFFISNIRLTEARDPALAVSGVASPENAAELAVFAAVGTLALMQLLVQRLRIGFSGSWLLMIFGLVATTSTAWSRVPLFSFVRGAQIIVVAVLSLATAGLWVTRRRDLDRDWSRIWTWFLGIVLPATVLSLMVGSYVGGRFTWPGHHPGVTGQILGVAALVCLSMLLEPGWHLGARMKRFVPVLLASAVIAMGLTVSRTAILGLSLSAILLFVSANRFRMDLRVLSISGALLLLGGIVVAFAEEIFGFVARGADMDQLLTLTGRTELWSFAGRVLGQSPLGGFGYGAGRLVLLEEIPWAGTGHNLWVEAAISLGVIGLVLVTGLLLWLAVAALRNQRLTPGPIGNLSIALVAFEGIAAVTGSSFALPGVGLTLVGLLSAALTARLLLTRNVDRPGNLSEADR